LPQSVRGQSSPAHREGRRARFVLAAAAVALLAVFAEPGVAQAATVLGDGQWITPNGDVQPTSTDYSVTTTRPYWSVAFLRNGYVYPGDDRISQKPRYYLQALNSTGTVLATSDQGFFPNFVAIDGNIRPAQTYTARVLKHATAGYSGEQYGLTFEDGNSIIPQGRSYLTAPTGTEPDKVYVRDIFLNANTIDTINIAAQNSPCPEPSPAPNVPTVEPFQTYLLASDPANPASAVSSASSALDHSQQYIESAASCDLQLSAVITRSAWYGVVVFAPFAQMSVDVYSVPSNVIS
jgi:hypothetical protein